MSSRELRIVGDYLHDLASRAQEATNLLSDCSQMAHLDFTGNEGVENEFTHFLSRWDRHRGEIREGMETVAKALAATRDAFEQVEDELVGALEGNADSAPTY